MKDDLNAPILLLGHHGMVGSAIHKKLKSRGYRNILLRDIDDIDLRRQEEVEKLFAFEKPDYVFLAAAKVGGIVANDTYKAEFIYDNMAIALNVINSAYENGVNKLLNLGSSCIYPKYAPQPMKEDHLLSGKLESTNEPYAIAKISAIKLCRYYNEQYGTDFISVMPTNLYGLNDNYNLETSHVLPALVRKIILAKALMENDYETLRKDIEKRTLGFGLDKEITDDDKSIKNALEKTGINQDSVEIWGTGNVRREFMHANDMADACVYFMENVSEWDMGEFVNLGTGIDISIRELAETIKNIVGYEGELRFNPGKPEGAPRKLLDVSRARSLGWEARISLEKGIKMVIDNYMK